jgi:ketosteroid isomerase-like protein
MPTPSEVSTAFLTRFFTGDIARAASMVSPDFSFRAPLQDAPAGKAAYFGGAEKKSRFVKGFRILRQWEDGPEVSTLYEIRIETPEGKASLVISDWHTIREGQVASIVMVFDSAARAAHLLGAALSTRH